jgi:hypothetical protein
MYQQSHGVVNIYFFSHVLAPEIDIFFKMSDEGLNSTNANNLSTAF